MSVSVNPLPLLHTHFLVVQAWLCVFIRLAGRCNVKTSKLKEGLTRLMLAIWNLNLSCMTLNKPFSLPAPLFPGEKCSNSTPHSQEDHSFGRFPSTVATGSGKGFGQREYPAGVCWGGSDTKFAGLNPSSTLQLCFSDKKKRPVSHSATATTSCV